MSDDQILGKLQKLLALAKSPNPNEAGVALAKAQELMAKHSLSFTDLERHTIGMASVRSTQSVSKPKDWESSLVVAVASAFGCKVLWEASNSYAQDIWGRFELVGPKHQLPTAEHFCVYLLRTVVKQRRQFAQTLRGFQLPKPAMTQELDGFCHGFVKIIRSKLHDFTNDEATTKALDAYVEANSNGQTAKLQKRQAGAHGFHAGEAAAADVELHRPMDGQTAAPRLGGAS